jgi:Matrixin
MRNRILLGGLILGAVLSAVLVGAYTLQLDTSSGAAVFRKWPTVSGQPILTWEINPATNPNNVDISAGGVEAAMQNAFAAWTGAQVNGQSITSISPTTVIFGGTSSLNDPNTTDCVNVISFEPTSATSFPTGIVAYTFVGWVTNSLPYTYTCGGNTLNGVLASQIIGADVVFNPQYCFSTAQPPPSSLPACPSGPVFDLQSIGTHEVGHMLGLDHSGLGHATMFPFGDAGTSAQRSLGVDDAVGEAFLYPNGSFATATGTVAGTVTLLSVGPAFASHVVLLDQQTGIAVTDALTAPDGTYALNGVPPGNYNLIALPLSGVYTVDNFTLWTCGYASGANCTGVPSNPVNYSGTFWIGP